jgi:hypothetical protein
MFRWQWKLVIRAPSHSGIRLPLADSKGASRGDLTSQPDHFQSNVTMIFIAPNGVSCPFPTLLPK